MAKPAKAAAEEAEAPAKPKSKRLLLAVVAVLLLGALGGGAWFLLKGIGKHEEKKEEPKSQPVTLDLETFTINLQPEEGEKFLQVDITLELASPQVQEKVAEKKSKIYNNLVLLMSSKRPSELISNAGKIKLQQEIAREVNTVLGIQMPPEKKPVHEGEAASGVAAQTEAAASAPAPEAAAPPAQEAAAGGVLAVYFKRFIVQ